MDPKERKAALDRALRRLQVVYPGLPAVEARDQGQIVAPELILEAMRLYHPGAREALEDRILILAEWEGRLCSEVAQLYWDLHAILDVQKRIREKAEELSAKVVQIPPPPPPPLAIVPAPAPERPGLLDRLRAWGYRRGGNDKNPGGVK